MLLFFNISLISSLVHEILSYIQYFYTRILFYYINLIIKYIYKIQPTVHEKGNQKYKLKLTCEAVTPLTSTSAPSLSTLGGQ